MSIPSQMVYHLIINAVAPIITSGITSMYTIYSAKKEEATLVRTETDDEGDLTLLQMDRLLKWMSMVFDDSYTSTASTTSQSDLQKAYKKELYCLYTTIVSDYRQYQQWVKYNKSIWVLSYYRNKDTKSLAKRIIGDITLFKEGLKMFTMFT